MMFLSESSSLIIPFLQMKKLRLREMTDIYPLSKYVPEAGQELKGHKNSGRGWGAVLDRESPKDREPRPVGPSAIWPLPASPLGQVAQLIHSSACSHLLFPLPGMSSLHHLFCPINYFQMSHTQGVRKLLPERPNPLVRL